MKIKKHLSKVVAMACLATTMGGGAVGAMLSNPTTIMAAENTKTITVDGTKVNVPVKGYKWLTVKGKTYFAVNGSLVKGWKTMDKSVGESIKHWSYFHPKTGALYTGWHKMGSLEGEKIAHWSYFGSNGWLRTGWQAMGKGTSNSFEENTTKHWSYFGDNGWLRTGWQDMGKGTRNPDGNTAKHKSFFGSDGWLRTNVWEGDWYLNGNGWRVEREGALYPTNGRKSVIVGDSRTLNSYQAGANKTLTTMKNKSPGTWVNVNGNKEAWFAEWGRGYNWFNDNLTWNIESKLKNNSDLIVLLGINDTANAKNYANKLNALANKHAKNGVRIYFVSANPVKGSSAAKLFNNDMRKYLKNNVYYINTHDNVKFTYTDNVHYDARTSRDIMNYVKKHVKA